MASRYWVGSGSSTNWDAVTPTNWSATDGGANDASVPTTGDDVFLKSSADCVANIATSPAFNSYNMTGYTGTFSGARSIRVAPSTGTVVLLLAGTVTWAGYLMPEPTGTAIVNVTTGGKTISGVTVFAGNQTGTVNFQDAITATTNVALYAGAWNTNGYAISCAKFQIYAGATVGITNSTITAANTSTLDAWNCASGATLTTTGSTINAGLGHFHGGGKSYNTATFTGDGAIIIGNNTFTTMNVNTAGLATGLIFTTDSIQTVTNFATNGSAGNLAKIQSDSAGSHFHLTTASAEINVDYISIKDSVADQANTWYAGVNSINVSGNSGWVFAAPTANIPAAMHHYKMMRNN